MYFRILFILFALYILYRFLFDFLLPVYRASKRVHRQFQDMQDQMNGQSNPNQTDFTSSEPPSKSASVKKDYIDFEEIKD